MTTGAGDLCSPYGPHSQHSYFQDLSNQRDPQAAARLAAHRSALDGEIAEHFSDNYKAAFGKTDQLFAHNVTAVVGQVTVSADLLDSSLLTMTEAATGLEVKATIDEVLFDDMRAAYGGERRFVVHEHVEAKPTRRQRIRARLGDVLRSFAARLSPVDDERDD